MTLKISKWLFLLLIVSLPLARPLSTQFDGLKIPLTDFIFLGAFLFWLFALFRRETRLKFDKFYIFLAFYASALLISTVFSAELRRSAIKLAGEFYLFALALFSFQMAFEKGFFKRIAAAWLIGTVLTVVATIAGLALFYTGYKTQADNYFLSHFGSLPAGNYPRLHALFANANMMCNFLNVSLMLALLAARKGWLKKWPAGFLHGGIWLAALFTFSAGLGGMFLSLGLWLWSGLKSKSKIALSRLAFAAGIFFAVFFFAAILISRDTANTDQDFRLPFSERVYESSVRVLVWQDALRTFVKYPFLGKGTGTDAAFVKYQTLSGDRQILLDAHNSWLNVLAQNGLLGLAAFVLLIGFWLSRCRFMRRENESGNLTLAALSCAFLGAFIYQSLSGSFEDARHLWILSGLLVAAAHEDFNRFENDI